jgi:hypothetical protein
MGESGVYFNEEKDRFEFWLYYPGADSYELLGYMNRRALLGRALDELSFQPGKVEKPAADLWRKFWKLSQEKRREPWKW